MEHTTSGVYGSNDGLSSCGHYETTGIVRRPLRLDSSMSRIPTTATSLNQIIPRPRRTYTPDPDPDLYSPDSDADADADDLWLVTVGPRDHQPDVTIDTRKSSIFERTESLENQVELVQGVDQDNIDVESRQKADHGVRGVAPSASSSPDDSTVTEAGSSSDTEDTEDVLLTSCGQLVNAIYAKFVQLVR